MRCNPWRWLWGVIPIAMLTWLACNWEREGIETDLRSRAEAALESKGYGWGEVSLEGRDAFLTGVAPDDAQPYRATETIRNIKGIRIVRSRTDAAPATAGAPAPAAPETAEVAPPEPEGKPVPENQPEPSQEAAAPQPEPSTSNATVQELSSAEREELEAKWRAAEDNERSWRSSRASSLAANPPADDSAKLKAEAEAKAADEAKAAEQAKAMEEAKAAADAKAAHEARAAEDAKAAEEAKIAAEAKAAAAQAAEDAKSAEAAKAEDEAKVAAEAKAKDEETARAAAAEAEKKQLAEDEQRKADEREQAEAEAEAQRLADEKAKAAEDAETKRKADAEAAAAKADQDAADAKQKSAQAVAEARNMDAADTKRKAEADHCQGLMQSAMAEGVINFDRAKADLTRDSFLTLDRLAGIVRVCPKAHINIAGHTDGEGEVARNQGLSERRAKAVGDYLIAKGVEASRVTTQGFGKSRPLASNDTPEGMRQNRRIEFNVTPAP